MEYPGKISSITSRFSRLRNLIAIAVLFLAQALEARAQTDSTPATFDQKIRSITLSLDFNNASLEEAVAFLSIESKRLAADHKPITITLRPGAAKAAQPVTLTLNHVPFAQALHYIAELAGVKVREGVDALQLASATDSEAAHFGLELYLPTDPAAKRTTEQKLDSLIIDRVNFEKLDIAVALQFLQQKSRELDPDHRGINFVLRLPTAGESKVGRPLHRAISITLDSVPISELLGYIVSQTNLQYSVENDVVYFQPLGDR